MTADPYRSKFPPTYRTVPLSSFPPPPYLPVEAHAALPWTRRYVSTVVARHGVCPADAWDEAVTALLRATVYFRPGAGTFHAYAQSCVVRGLWRYVRRDALRSRRALVVSLDRTFGTPLSDALTTPSPEIAAAALCDPPPQVGHLPGRRRAAR